MKSTNIIQQFGFVDFKMREELLNQKGCTIWLTGLPSSGKSTLAYATEYKLVQQGYLAYVLDGDNIRFGLNKNLGFTAEDRKENIRRIGEVTKLFTDAGVITFASFISPYRVDRDRVRSLYRSNSLTFIEVFVDAPVEICEQRDPKGLYKKARQGKIRGFTGVDDPYEPPLNPELVLKTTELTEDECVTLILDKIGIN